MNEQERAELRRIQAEATKTRHRLNTLCTLIKHNPMDSSLYELAELWEEITI